MAVKDEGDLKEFRFARYVLDSGRRELLWDGEAVDIQPRVFDLLLYLARHRHRAVGKNELQDAVWPGMVITETALTRAVMKARKAVGDDANRQGVIKTVHGHGYRFVAELVPALAAENAVPPVLAPLGQPAQAAVQPPAQPSEPASAQACAPTAAASAGAVQPRRRPLSRTWLALCAVLLLVAVAAGLWGLLRPPPAGGAEPRIAVLPLRDDTGDAELAWTRLGLMSYVSNMVQADGRLQVLADGSVISLAEALGWREDLQSPPGTELVERLREVYGASHVLAMQLQAEGGALRLNYSLLGPDDRLQRGTMVGDEGTGLAQGVVQSVVGLLLGRRQRAAELPLVSADPFNNEAFARGMDLSLQGRCDQAISFFQLVIGQEPSLFAPRFEYAACQRILGDNTEAEQLLDALLEEQRQLGPSRQLAQALMTRGVVYNRTGRLDLAETDHREALAVAGEVGDEALRGRILQNLSIVHEDRGEFQQAEELLDLAVLAYQAAGRETLPGQLYSARANLCMDRGELVEARDYLEQALAAFRQAGDRRNEAMMLNNTGYLLRQLGRLEEAEDYHQRSLAMRQEIGDRVGVGRVYGQLSALYEAQGRYREAADAAESALAVARETNDRLYEGTSLGEWAAAEHRLGDREAARRHYRESRVVFTAIQDRMRVLQTDVRLARLDLEEGALEEAEHTALAVVDEARAQSLIQPEVEAMELLGEIARGRGDLPGAIRGFETALVRVRDSSWQAKEAGITVQLMNAHLDAGDLEAAAPLAGALAGHEPSVEILTARARFAYAMGDAGRGEPLLAQAKALAGPGWNEQAEPWLVRLRGEQ